MINRWSDEQLISEVMNGNKSALEPLVTRYHTALLGYLYRLTNGNRLLAEDLVQETFIHLLRQGSYQASRPFKPWLYSIATHLAYDAFRSQSNRRMILMDEDTMANWVDPAPGPEQQVQMKTEGEVIAAALARLGDEYRAALLLRFYQGLSLQEIAEALTLPLGTVKSRLSVGAQRLRGLLTRTEQGEER
jgi:RNA polymerase sigma-70 factor (ECF subfamily)